MLVPGCSPGLFTKQFVEFAPAADNVANIFSAVIPQRDAADRGAGCDAHGSDPRRRCHDRHATDRCRRHRRRPITTCRRTTRPRRRLAISTTTAGAPVRPSTPQPRTYPYLNDEFFYTGYGGATTIDPGSFRSAATAADGWFKMFEFFEVPSQAIGAIGPVASGIEFRLAAAGHQAGPAQPEPDHGRGGVLQRRGQAERSRSRTGSMRMPWAMPRRMARPINSRSSF